MPKFRVVQEVAVEADNPHQAAALASAKIRASNIARYDVTDEAGYTFHVSLEDVSLDRKKRPDHG